MPPQYIFLLLNILVYSRYSSFVLKEVQYYPNEIYVPFLEISIKSFHDKGLVNYLLIENISNTQSKNFYHEVLPHPSTDQQQLSSN